MKMNKINEKPEFIINSERVAGIQPKEFVKGGHKHNYVRIFIETKNANDLSMIDLVQYELHPSFKNRIRVSDKRSEKFDIKIWTYGYFIVKAKLLFFDGTTDIISGFVRW